MKLHLPKMLAVAVLAAVAATGAYATSLSDATVSISSFTTENLEALSTDGWIVGGFAGNISDGVFTSTTSAATIASGEGCPSLTTDKGSNRYVWSGIVTMSIDSLKSNASHLLYGGQGGTASKGVGLGASGTAVTGTRENNASYFSLGADWSTLDNGDGTVTLGVVYEGGNGVTVYVGGNSQNLPAFLGRTVSIS